MRYLDKEKVLSKGLLNTYFWCFIILFVVFSTIFLKKSFIKSYFIPSTQVLTDGERFFLIKKNSNEKSYIYYNGKKQTLKLIEENIFNLDSVNEPSDSIEVYTKNSMIGILKF